ncbi:MAG: sigma-54-dependent Fis family transcriptional regulator [Odoribacter sp.]|nr:sigma-54-dependent Fis family transcriptional regulator [Bacteroidales bacterium]MBR2981037.1 sigma-54-dependent Fis family transcriptional regulator [Odoribacter sp.]
MDEELFLNIKQRYGIVGNNSKLKRAIDVAIQVANTNLSVLITGESGVGKEALPKIIHDNSARKHAKYIAVNCGAIPEGTIDSELFGHVKGAFTGALNERKGYFEEANGGTIFLDEVGELPYPTQARLLRVLESGEFIKVGSSTVQKTDVRVIAATNVNMAEAVKRNKFREDLFYRLNTIPIHIPSLRERPDDIPLLFRYFANRCTDDYKMPRISVTPEAEQILKSYPWPGNIRQLKNITEQIALIERARVIDEHTLASYLPHEGILVPMHNNGTGNNDTNFANEREILYKVLFDMKKDMNEMKKLVHNLMQRQGVRKEDIIHSADIEHEIFDTKVELHSVPKQFEHHEQIITPEEIIEETFSLEEREKETILKALRKNGGKRKQTAIDLGISERTLYRKLKDYNIE